MLVHYDVFLSHSGLDDNLAKDVKKLLEHNKISVFCTPTSIPSGKWEQQIEDALKNSNELWVLLTANALSQSVWVHQELGYFYGFSHGRGVDDLGNHSHYLYEEGTLQPGLYAHLQGTMIKELGNPIEIAVTIASHLEKSIEVPAGWEHLVHETHTQVIDANAKLFENERSDFSTELISKIRGIGHWEVIIRPREFLEKRVSDYLSLSRIVGQCHVQHSDWDFPSFDQSGGENGSNWFGDSFDEELPESWRIYQSGQFVHIWAFGNDLSDHAIQRGLLSEQAFVASSTVNYLTCVYEFAAKISNTIAGDRTIVVETSANNVKGRAIAGSRGLLSGGSYRTQAERLLDTRVVSRDQLASQSNELARSVSREWFKRFLWGPDEAQISAMQEQLLR